MSASLVDSHDKPMADGKVITPPEINVRWLRLEVSVQA